MLRDSRPALRILSGIALALVLVACSSGTPSLTTGTLFGGAKTKPKADEPTRRMLSVATTSARAARCGYNFDPARLRTGYLAYESTQGGGADQIAKLEKGYDYTRASVLQKLGPPDEYCTDDKTAEIKRELTRHLAGDYTAPPEKATLSVFGSGSAPAFDREKIFDPLKR